MTRTLVATADPTNRSNDAPTARPLPERSPNSPDERRCQDCWWADETRRYLAGEPVDGYALPVLRRRHGERNDPAGP